MITALLIISNALLGETSDLLYGAISADVPTFHLTANSQDFGFVALESGSDWYRGTADSLPANGIGMMYLPDTPWLRAVRAKLPRGAELSPEIPAARRDRLKNGWKANHFAFVKTPAGTEIAVSDADSALAMKSLEDAAKIEKRSAPENLVIGAAARKAPGGATAVARPAWRGYIGHAIVIVVALIVGAVIVKVLLLDDESGGWEKI